MITTPRKPPGPPKPSRPPQPSRHVGSSKSNVSRVAYFEFRKYRVISTVYHDPRTDSIDSHESNVVSTGYHTRSTTPSCSTTLCSSVSAFTGPIFGSIGVSRPTSRLHPVPGLVNFGFREFEKALRSHSRHVLCCTLARCSPTIIHTSNSLIIHTSEI